MTENVVYELFGRQLDTTLDLPCPTTNHAPDVVVTIGSAQTIDREPAPGSVLADRVDTGGMRWYSLSRQVDRTVLRVPTVCDLTIAADGGTLHFTPDPARTDEFLAILLAGTGISAMLMLEGRQVLHGSAVATGEQAIGFLGDSGQGKSTLTALSCLAGWSLVCDDVLHLEGVEGSTICHPGGQEIRLRPTARTDPGWPTRLTVDERRAVSPPSVDAAVELGALVIPFPNRTITTFEAQLLDRVDAIGRVMYYSRITGWHDQDMLRQIFDQATDLAFRLPVWEVQIP